MNFWYFWIKMYDNSWKLQRKIIANYDKPAKSNDILWDINQHFQSKKLFFPFYYFINQQCIGRKVLLFFSCFKGGTLFFYIKIVKSTPLFEIDRKLWNWHACLCFWNWCYEIDMFVFIFLFQILDGEMMLERGHVYKLIKGKE